jgi:hypothetical protein
LRVKPPIFFHMRLVAIGGDGHALRRHRHLRRRDVAQLQEARKELSVAGGKADAQPRQVRALGQRLEFDHVRKIGTRRFEHARRRAPGVDFGIAFVAEHQETEPPRESDHACEISEVGNRALRVGRRGDEESDGAREQLFGERVEIGKKAGGRGGRQIDRLAIGRHRARGIGGVEGIGNEHRRAAATAADPACRGDGGEKQPFARAVEHQDFTPRIDRTRQREAPSEPAGGRLAKVVEAFVHGIAAELVDVGGDHARDECRHAMLRFAHRQADRGLAGLDVAQKFAQPHEGRAANVGPHGRGGRNAFGGGHEHRQSGASTRRTRDVLP